MATKTRNWILRRAIKVFFKAMLAGYAGDNSGVKKEKSPDGYTTLTWPPTGDHKGFVVVDRYCVTPHSDKSTGTTTIFFEGQPVWWMTYGGEYKKSTIPFLKEALKETYRQSKFLGGRGPSRFQKDNLVYVNRRGFDGTRFALFEGREEIVEIPSLNSVGFHKYFGMLLI